ncbi:hypothetical protein PV343_01810 [Streptomyces sp. WI03-4A]|uniref:hypothetical protein n=1 Tax=Streptomyces TaxID=1883 RepID=UPI0029B59A76|nr:hypothetical protein [Streptomyces sp. WI03-4A]
MAGHVADHHAGGGVGQQHGVVPVLRGRVRPLSGDDTWEGITGDLLVVPAARHSLEALEDAAALLTVAETRTP